MKIIKMFPLVTLFFSSSCAFFVDGRQEVTLGAYPEDTIIILNGEEVGKGKANVKLDPAKGSYSVNYIREGCANYSNIIKPKSNSSFVDGKTRLFCTIDEITSYASFFFLTPIAFAFGGTGALAASLLFSLSTASSALQPKCSYTFNRTYYHVMDKGANLNIIHQGDKFQ